MSHTSDLGPIPFADEGKNPEPRKLTVRPLLREPARLPLWLAPDSGLTRGGWLIVILSIITLGYFWVLTSWLGYANPGVDQSGYHSMGRLMAEQQTAHWVPSNPWQFISRMSIVTETGNVFAKYPPGYPLLIAIGRIIAADTGAYIINPIATAAACFMSYFLFRTVLSRATAMFGVLWMMTNPVVLLYATDANSHPTTIFCVVTGFWGLLTWWQKGDYWRAWIGGFALGYTCTIRYSEALLVLPVIFAALANFRLRKRNILGGLSLILGWAIPVGALALFCWYSFGLPWKTGYTYCNEDTGFSIRYLIDGGEPWFTPNWESLITQINRLGLFLLWPLSFAGLAGLAVRNWRPGFTVALWVLPATLLYLCYYWAPNQETNVGYLRFFVSVIPGLILTGLWLVERAALAVFHSKWTGLSFATGFGVLAATIGVLYFWPEAGSYDSWKSAAVAFGPAALCVGFVAVLLIGAWFFERDQGAIGGPVVIIGLLTLVGCGFNLYDNVAKLDSQLAQQMSMRNFQDELNRVAPKGSVVFADDQYCNYIDCNGGYELYQNSMFLYRERPPGMPLYESAVKTIEKVDRGAEAEFEPDPFQPERARAIINLLGELRGGVMQVKPKVKIEEHERRIIADAWARGQRVFMVRAESINNAWQLNLKPLPFIEEKNRRLKGGVSLPLNVRDTKETKAFAGIAQRVSAMTDMRPVGNVVVSKNGIRRNLKKLNTPVNPSQPMPMQTEPSRVLVIYEVIPDATNPTPPPAPPRPTLPAVKPQTPTPLPGTLTPAVEPARK